MRKMKTMNCSSNEFGLIVVDDDDEYDLMHEFHEYVVEFEIDDEPSMNDEDCLH